MVDFVDMLDECVLGTVGVEVAQVLSLTHLERLASFPIVNTFTVGASTRDLVDLAVWKFWGWAPNRDDISDFDTSLWRYLYTTSRDRLNLV